MYDNKVRLSADVIEKAQAIASEWGLKNTRAAVEAVFRRYADDYLYGRTPLSTHPPTVGNFSGVGNGQGGAVRSLTAVPSGSSTMPTCEALDELDDLLGA